MVRRAGDLADVGDGGAGGVDAGVEDAHELHLRQRQHVLGRMGFSGGGWCWSRGRGFGGRRRGLTLAVVRRRAARMWARWGGSRISETSLFAMAITADGLWGEREIGGLDGRRVLLGGGGGGMDFEYLLFPRSLELFR